MKTQTSEGSHRFNPALIAFSFVFVVAYVFWELRFPAESRCGVDPIWSTVARVLLVLGWIANINLIRARRGAFCFKHFLYGAFSGGGAPLIAVVLLMLIELVSQNILGLDATNLLHIALISFPLVIISGLYSAFAANVEVAIGQGITCLALQLALLFMTTLSDMCVY